VIQRICHKHGRIGCECGKRKAWANADRRRQTLPRGWEKLRLMILARDPLCQDGRRCKGMALSTQVDHIRPGTDHSLENLQGICRDCHAAKSAAEGVDARR
jgi:5-methylcytosine-specific restriction protein A